VKIEVLRKYLAELTLIRAAAHAHVIWLDQARDDVVTKGFSDILSIVEFVRCKGNASILKINII